MGLDEAKDTTNEKGDGPQGADQKSLAPSDVEGKQVKLPYPRAIPFIISNEFCERFNYYGMRTILVLYLTRKLLYDDDSATIMYHTFSTMVYFMCIFGAIISDSWLGKFKTIFILSIVYSIGSIVISLGAIPPIYLPSREMTILGLALIAVGSGGIKPCVAAFGGDQFKMPEQAAQMATFFSIFYFAINSGSLISTTVTPILRQDVKCFDQDDCFSLAFGIPGILMIVSIVVFVFGKFLYVSRPPSGNMVVLVSKCIGNAIVTKYKEGKSNPRKHWLDYASDKYGKQLVSETKVVLKILVLYIPLPLFWSLFDQQGSRWTFQATRMSGQLGSIDVKPDQMQLVNPLLILAFIPLYDVVFYPLLSKIGIRRPLQKLALGGIFAGIAFLCSAFVEMQLEKTYPVLPSEGFSQIRIYNTFPCEYHVETSIPNHAEFVLKSLDVFEEKYVAVENRTSFSYKMKPQGAGQDQCIELTGEFNLKTHSAISYYGASKGTLEQIVDDPAKSRTGDPLLRVLVYTNAFVNVSVFDVNNGYRNRHKSNASDTDLFEVIASTYDVTIGDRNIKSIVLRQGSVTNLLVSEVSENTFRLAEPNDVHIFWQIPQYVILTLGEVMFSVTGLQFSYSQAPESMKSVIQAFWQLTVAFGNLIDIIIVGAKIFNEQSNEFFLFGGLMFVDMFLFMLLAWRFKSVEQEEAEQQKEDEALAINRVSDQEKKPSGIDNVAFKKDDD